MQISDNEAIRLMIAWIGEVVDRVLNCGPRYKPAFAPLLLGVVSKWCQRLKYLWRDVERRTGVSQQSFNIVMRYHFSTSWILFTLGGFYIFIECAKKLSAAIPSIPMLRGLSELEKMLEDLASERKNRSIRIFGFSLPDHWVWSSSSSILLDACWSGGFERKKENELSETKDVKFLGAGSGVLKTNWLGVPCVQKEFHVEVSEAMFLKEMEIMTWMVLPYNVRIICYGKGDRFIAMELVDGEKCVWRDQEKKGVHFLL